MVIPKYDDHCTIVVNGADAKIDGLVPWKIVIDATSYYSPGYQFTPRFQLRKWDGRIKLFRTAQRTFPAGLLQDVKKALEDAQIRVSVDDRRNMPALPQTSSDWLRGLKLEGVNFDPPYDYQPQIAETMLKSCRGIVFAATNSGKSEIACLVTAALRLPTLFIVPGKELLHQTRDRFMRRLRVGLDDVGIIGDSHWRPGSWITVGTAQSLANSLRKTRGLEFLKSIQIVFADECFPAGTKVGGKSIESVREGEFVRSFDAKTGNFYKSRVVRRFVSRPSSLVRIRFGEQQIVCTPGHPFWTKRGWVPAAQLTLDDKLLRFNEVEEDLACFVLPLRKEDSADPKQRKCCLFTMQKVPEENNFYGVCGVRQRSAFDNPCPACSSPKEKGLLFGSLQKDLDVQAVFRSDDEDKFGTSRNHFEKNEREQPYARFEDQAKDEKYVAVYGLEASYSGREWKRSDSSRKNVSDFVGVENRRNGFDQKAERVWVSDSLQTGCRQQRSKNCGGDRRRFPQSSGKERAGFEEREISFWVGVESVEVLEQGRDGTFGGVCPDGLVYNIEVEKTHTYLAEGVVVHNCHHVGSDQWYQVLRACNAYFRFGLSGTPLKRTDGADLRLIGATGPVIAEIRNKELIERGISCETEIRVIKITKPTIPEGTPYPDAYRLGISKNPFRNRVLCKIVEELCQDRLSHLVLVKEVAHGVAFSDALWKYCSWVPNQFISGKESSDVRQKALSDFKKRDLPVLIATSILDEGVDLPNIDVLVLAGGGKSAIKSMQRIGRGLRTGSGNNKLIVIDTADFQNEQYLLKHSLQRIEDYKAEDCFQITVVDG